MASPSSHISCCIFNFGFNSEMDLLASSFASQCHHCFPLETPLPLGAFELKTFNHSWQFWMSYIFPSTVLVPIVLFDFLVEHVTGQDRFLILCALCWMEAPWLPTIQNILEDILVSVPPKRPFQGWVDKPCAKWSDPLGDQRCVLHRKRFSPSVYQLMVGVVSIYIKSLLAILEKKAGWCTQGVVLMSFSPKMN